MKKQEAVEAWAEQMGKDLKAVAYGAAMRHLREDGIIQGRCFNAERRGFGSLSPSTMRLCDGIVRDILEHIFTADGEIGDAWERVSGAVKAAMKEDVHGDHTGAE